VNDRWDRVAEEARAFPEGIRERAVVSGVGAEEIRAHLTERFGDFSEPRSADEVVDDVAAMVGEWSVHVTHPRYFGLFNPSVHPAAAAGEALAAIWNPQLAVWSHAPAANEIERHVLRFLASRLGFPPDEVAASFATGGAEANLSAVLCALSRTFPRWAEEGVAALPGPVGIYVSAECHDSLTKVARMTGLGRGALRVVPVDRSLAMDPAALRLRIARDRQRGRRPLAIVGTAGTTGAGAVDPLPALADVAEETGAWFHVDAAWGGSAALSERLRGVLAGIERADSVTWDAHKWLSVPMGAGMFFCRHPRAVAMAFSVRTSYMPGSVRETSDPYLGSAQWSRRFIGLKLFMMLAEIGESGVAAMIDHQAAMGDRLREMLAAAGWRVVNDTPLPLVCFTHPRIESGKTTAHDLERAVLRTGRAWISSVRLGDPPVEALRACVTSYRTTEEDLRVLVEVLTDAKDAGQRFPVEGPEGAEAAEGPLLPLAPQRIVESEGAQPVDRAPP